MSLRKTIVTAARTSLSIVTTLALAVAAFGQATKTPVPSPQPAVAAKAEREEDWAREIFQKARDFLSRAFDRRVRRACSHPGTR